MNSKLCDDVERSIWRYIDRELSARDVSGISVHLKDCRSCNRLFEARSRENSLYRLAYVESPFGDDFADRFREIFPDCAEAPEDAASDIFTFDPPARHRRLAVGISVAAILGIAVVGMLLRSGASPDSKPDRSNRGDPIAGVSGGNHLEGNHLEENDLDDEDVVATPLQPELDDGSNLLEHRLGVFLKRSERLVERIEGGVAEQLAGNAIRSGAIYQLRAGPAGLVEDGDRVELALLDGSVLAFSSSPWRFEIAPGSSSHDETFEGFLRQGELDASIVRRSKDGAFAIRTPNALLRVVGTRFHVRVVAVGRGVYFTAIRVLDGEVEVHDLDTDQRELLGPREDELLLPAAPPERSPPSSSSPDLDRPFQIPDDSGG